MLLLLPMVTDVDFKKNVYATAAKSFLQGGEEVLPNAALQSSGHMLVKLDQLTSASFSFLMLLLVHRRIARL